MPLQNARQTSGISNANEANCDVNCFDESSIVNSGDRPSVLRSGRLKPLGFALLVAVLCRPLPVMGQGWDALFSDYLLTGQEPRPAVARVVAPDGSGTSLGSGVLVDINASQALVLTNWHVVRDSRSAVLVQFPDGFQSAGTVLRVDSVWDLAAIVIWKPNVEPVPLASHAPGIGEQLTIAGYGRGPYREVGGCTQYLSPGSGQPMELVELVAEARQGDSGGPIFNARGELAGVLFGESGGRTIGASIPRVRGFLASIGSDGYAVPLAPASPAAVAAASPLEASPEVGKPMLSASHRPGAVTAQASGSDPSVLPTGQTVAGKGPDMVLATHPRPVSLEQAADAPTGSGGAELPMVSPETITESAENAPLQAATPEPPPLEFADLLAAVRSLAPSGNPTSVLVISAAAAMILFGLRGISRVVT